MQITINGAHQGEATDIELPALVEQGLFYIFLNYIGTLVPIHIRILNQSLDVVEVFAHLNATAPVGIFSWLDNPKALSKLREPIENGLLRGILGISEQLLELYELRVIESLFNVESNGKLLVVLLTSRLVIYLHVVINSFLVAQVVVILHLAVLQKTVGSVILFFFFVIILVISLLLGEAAGVALVGTVSSRC